MFSTVKRWCKNMAWLLNHPPVSFTQCNDPDVKCSYCDATSGLWNFPGVFTICQSCMKKAFDKMLKKNKKDTIKAGEKK